MKIFFRDLIIIIFYLTSIPFWRRLLLSKPLVRVWCLHEVKDHQLNQFEKKIKYLKENFNIIAPEEFKMNQLSSDKLNIMISFDDGFDSWFSNVLPILEKHNIKAIFFLNKEFYNRTDKLLDKGHSLGGHGYNHKRLTQVSDEELEREVWQSLKTEFFAYPFGDKKSFNKEVTNEVKKSGYQYAFNILPGFNNKKTNPLLLHRDSLDADVNDLIFRLWLKGCYDWLKRVF